MNKQISCRTFVDRPCLAFTLSLILALFTSKSYAGAYTTLGFDTGGDDFSSLSISSDSTKAGTGLVVELGGFLTYSNFKTTASLELKGLTNSRVGVRRASLSVKQFVKFKDINFGVGLNHPIRTFLLIDEGDSLDIEPSFRTDIYMEWDGLDPLVLGVRYSDNTLMFEDSDLNINGSSWGVYIGFQVLALDFLELFGDVLD